MRYKLIQQQQQQQQKSGLYFVSAMQVHKLILPSNPSPASEQITYFNSKTNTLLLYNQSGRIYYQCKKIIKNVFIYIKHTLDIKSLVPRD